MKTDTEILDFLNSSMGKLWARWDDAGYWEVKWKGGGNNNAMGPTLRGAVSLFMELEERDKKRLSLL